VRSSSLQQGRLALLAAGALWSLGGVAIKQLPPVPLAIAFYRSLFAALALLLLVALRARARAALAAGGGVRPNPVDLLVSAVLFAGLLVTFVTATQWTTAANAIILQYTAPIYVIGLSAVLLREPPHRADLAALALCMAGVGVLFFGGYGAAAGPPPGREAVGLVLAVLSGACFGLFTLWQRRLRSVDPLLLAGLNNAGAALVLALAIPWMGAVDARALVVLSVMGVVQIALPYVLFAWALQRVPGPEASLLTLIEPVLNPVWVALFVGERPGPATLLGGGLILVALLLRSVIWSRA
jgi:drug/metabolite transporter (DMT)-like permease